MVKAGFENVTPFLTAFLGSIFTKEKWDIPTKPFSLRVRKHNGRPAVSPATKINEDGNQ
jgi:hypothetical protein